MKIDQKINHGFIEPKVLDEHYRFGLGQIALNEPLQLNSDWTSFLPKDEDQNLRDIETYNCTSFATTNQIESYMQRKFGITANYSDRFLALVAGVHPPGADPQVVYEAVRKFGLVPEEMCPFSEDIKTTEDYFSWKGVNKEACLAEGKKWLRQYKFTHDWVADGKEVSVDVLRTALQYSMLCGAVYAWATDGNGIYQRTGDDTHWTSFYKIDAYIEDFDSYDPNRKQLALDFGIKYAKRIHIEVNTDPDNIGLMQQLIALLIELRDLYQRLIKRIYGGIKNLYGRIFKKTN